MPIGSATIFAVGGLRSLRRRKDSGRQTSRACLFRVDFVEKVFLG
jgi:hypothetical protein